MTNGIPLSAPRPEAERQPAKAVTLMLLRIALGLLFVVWGTLRLRSPDVALGLSRHFYGGMITSSVVLQLFAVVEIVVGLLTIAGAARRGVYWLVLVINGATLLVVWRSIVDPLGIVLGGTKVLFFPSLIVFAGSLVLWAFRDEDTLAVDQWIHSPPVG
jgi:putative oxidoreductase